MGINLNNSISLPYLYWSCAVYTVISSTST